jgi:transcriptional regulator with XRE-family HTH domain
VNVAEKFGHNLFMTRRRAGLSQEQLAELASLHRTEIGMLERGIRLPRIDTLVKLMGALEADADELLVGLAWLPGATRSGRFSEGDLTG